ncbi:YciI family protein [Paenibacillus gansuensis]|uniref:YciI family protein n=1 Tax=Paenibacillus gansuensis TaxID=306542 RepID=A0ABW5PGT5_9BACL
MKYLCIGYFDRDKMDASPKEDVEQAMSQCEPHLQEFYNSGQVLIDAGLDVESRLLHRMDGKVRMLDGPFAETKEMIGSVFIIEAQDMEEAARAASLHPAVQVDAGERFGWRIEIRPIHYYKTSTPEA